jgi:hypothetical protein
MFGGLKMEKDLYYVIEDNGYHIYDRNDSLFHVHQYEPFIPNKNISYEENAKAQIEEFMKPPVGDVDVILDELEKEVGING